MIASAFSADYMGKDRAADVEAEADASSASLATCTPEPAWMTSDFKEMRKLGWFPRRLKHPTTTTENTGN